MKTRAYALTAALVLTALVAAPAAPGEQRPFTGRFTAQAAPGDPRCGDALTLGFEIEGYATHLGTFTGTGSNCTEWTLTTSAVAIWDGIATFTAADGSTITTTAEGSQAEPVAGRASFSIDHTVTGGTGRFTDATGLWTVSGVIDFTTGTITGRASGWLSHQG